jgi:UDP-glucose 4-epimerase
MPATTCGETMRILITGGSSFSGAFFVRQLAGAGHEVWTTFRSPIEDYEGIRGQRARMAAQNSTAVQAGFGDDDFLRLLKEQSFDAYCHHGAWTKDYRSMDYAFHDAFLNNTRNIQEATALLAKRGCRKVVVSASIFEGEVGLASSKEIPFSPHGLVKLFTSKTMEFYGNQAGMHVSRFVIPNPFGPLDNPKLIDYLCREWYAGREPQIRTPLFVRDNIHVDLLAHAFVHWVEKMPSELGRSVFDPAGYIGSMGDFVQKVAEAMRPRLGLSCRYGCAVQTDFSQPMVLVNSIPAEPLAPDWDESKAWDALAEHQKTLKSRSDK